jgi:DNA polymerase-3 subunit beta
MNFQIQVSKSSLDKILGILKHALDRRATLPILQYILLEVGATNITLKATDMELAFEVVIPSENCGSGAFVIPGKKFIDTVRVYPDGLLTLECQDNGNRVWLRARDFNSEHNIQAGECFPELPKPEPNLPNVIVPMSVFRKAAALGSISASKDVTKPALAGVLLHLSSNFIRVVSTDGFRLAVVELPCETGLEVDTRLIVPRRALDLLPLPIGDDSRLTISWDERSLYMYQSGLKISTRRITGNYPAYEKVLPSDLSKRVIIDREDFLKTLKIVGLKKDDYNKNVRLFFEFPNLRVFFQHPDEGVNQGTINFSGEEHPIELAFNIDYLTDLLEKLPGDDVVYNFKDDICQGIFMSPSVEDMTFRYVLMPVKFASSN